jgi:hypothetical protein
MEKYIIINTDKHNGAKEVVSVFYAALILSGQHAGKFATSENALKEFPKIFQIEPYEVVELDPSAFEIDYTPPALSTYRVAIPEYWEMLFPNDRFIVGGFDIPLERTKDNVLCVDVAYLGWQAFQNELDKPENAALKRHMEVVWDYIKLQIENNNFV